MSTPDYRAMIPGLVYRNQAFINGRHVPAASGKTFDCVSPIDGRVLTQVSAAMRRDVNRAWQPPAPPSKRAAGAPAIRRSAKKVLTRFAELILKHRDELALLETLDMGKPIASSAGGDIPARPRPSSGTARRPTSNMTRWRPIGRTRWRSSPVSPSAWWPPFVPWNYP